MDILKLKGTDKKLFELVAPLVMNPAVLRQNNNYPFKTGAKYVWYVAVEDGQVDGFIPLKRTADGGCLIDNYYIRNDDARWLNRLIAEIITDTAPNGDALCATVHKRHVKEFAGRGFRSRTEWKKYDKMQLCLPKN